MGTVLLLITERMSWISALRLEMFLLYTPIASLVLLNYSISRSFSAVTPSNLSERVLAVTSSFSRSLISSSRARVLLSSSF
jgi:hypothetical protein